MECPGGDPALQRLVVERLDDAIVWLESLGARTVWQETGNPRTVGKRFDPESLTAALVCAAGEPELGTSLPMEVDGPLVLATGGYPVRFAAEHMLLRRSNAWSDGGGIAYARARGAGLTGAQEEFYGRNMPAPPARIEEEDYVRLAQLYGRFAEVVNDEGDAFFAGQPSWSETDLVQATARQPGARAWYVLDEKALGQRVRERTVADMVALAPTAVEPSQLPFPAPPEAKVAVRVAPGITHTIGGLRIDPWARVLDEAGEPIAGLYAAGADVGGISTGGYASGLAAALVLGRVAAETALA